MKNNLKATLYFTALTVLFFWIGYRAAGVRGVFAASLFSALFTALALGWSDRLVLRIHRAEPLSEDLAPEVFILLREISGKAKLPLPAVYLIPSASTNAFATGRSRDRAALVLTQGAIEMLNREELKGILAHELAHIEEGDILISTLAAGCASFLVLLASGVKGMFWVGGGRDSKGGEMNPVVFVITGVLLAAAAFIIRILIPKSREYAADRKAAIWCGDPLYLASALSKLEAGLKKFPMRPSRAATAHLFILNPLEERLAGLFKTHPPVEERIARLEEAARWSERALNAPGASADIDAVSSSRYNM